MIVGELAQVVNSLMAALGAISLAADLTPEIVISRLRYFGAFISSDEYRKRFGP